MSEMTYGYDADSIVPEDFDTIPRKRGRKKKTEKTTSSKKNTKKEEFEEDDLQLIEALMDDENNEDIDVSALAETFEKYGNNIDLTCDTTGMINRLRNQSDIDIKTNTEHTAVGFVIKWCNRMMMKENYTDNELEAFNVIEKLMLHLGMI